ncbi:hypothetical protein [Microvirga lotononidis]|uniref:hypothetical protein n=1 Tax=Microvirga lotononidis TaxID=864069 RepID=UPI000A784973|nr:hypothetical protein [Microvirga lotononidis]WQO30104.1 hypothetical protein U0023_27470 [Microvirga lotononidis]
MTRELRCSRGAILSAAPVKTSGNRHGLSGLSRPQHGGVRPDFLLHSQAIDQYAEKYF